MRCVYFLIFCHSHVQASVVFVRPVARQNSDKYTLRMNVKKPKIKLEQLGTGEDVNGLRVVPTVDIVRLRYLAVKYEPCTRHT